MRCKKLSLGWKAALLAIFTVTGFVTSLHGATEKVLYNFNSVTDGYSPMAGLIFDATGNLYGTTSGEGGIGQCSGLGCGTVFELTRKAGGGWTEKVLHRFNNNLKDGLGPNASLILDAAGNLYGTTSVGGAHGLGTVFEVMHKAEGAWTEKILLTFNSKNGYWPNAGLIFDSSGNLYGTTAWGGAHERGTVFELTPKAGGSWTEKVLHSFDNNGKDGSLPNAGLIFDAAGNLYGATSGEGVSCSGLGCGTVFELSRRAGGSWTEKVLHAFNGKDGYWPNASLIFDAAGSLYGTTTYGGAYSGGTVFKLTPKIGGSWTEKVLHAFNGKDGSDPNAILVFDPPGNLYGTTPYGGAYGGGTVFELTRKAGGGWTEKVLHSFKGPTKDGFYPNSSLIFDAVGNLYGTTQMGGVYGCGTVFEITP